MTTPTRTTHYELLGVPPESGTRELKAAYRARAKELHPDSGGSEDDFEALQNAWRVLSDPSRRGAYDSWLADTRQLASGSTALQNRYDQRESEAERRSWEAKRQQARRKADLEKARRAADEERQRAVDGDIRVHRTLTIAAGALVVLVSALELSDGVGAGGGTADMFGASFDLPPTSPRVALVQIILGALVVAASLMIRPSPSAVAGPAARPSGERLPGSGRAGTQQAEAPGRFARMTGSSTWRVVLGVMAAGLAIWVVVPFVLLMLSNATLVLVAGAVVVGAALAWRR
ncbi:MAG: J domain-containing protein [Microthrixaceae bacterium]